MNIVKHIDDPANGSAIKIAKTLLDESFGNHDKAIARAKNLASTVSGLRCLYVEATDVLERMKEL
jgi:hypothetical protein